GGERTRIEKCPHLLAVYRHLEKGAPVGPAFGRQDVGDVVAAALGPVRQSQFIAVSPLEQGQLAMRQIDFQVGSIEQIAAEQAVPHVRATDDEANLLERRIEYAEF